MGIFFLISVKNLKNYKNLFSFKFCFFSKIFKETLYPLNGKYFHCHLSCRIASLLSSSPSSPSPLFSLWETGCNSIIRLCIGWGLYRRHCVASGQPFPWYDFVYLFTGLIYLFLSLVLLSPSSFFQDSFIKHKCWIVYPHSRRLFLELNWDDFLKKRWKIINLLFAI